MIRWHQIDKATGAIRQTVTASTRAEAVTLLGGGLVVSAASWKLDVFKYEPVKTVVTDVVQVQHRTGAPKLKHGLLGTPQAAQRLGITERKLRYLSERFRIEPQRIPYGSRHIYAYTPLQVEAIRQCITPSLGGSHD